MNNLCERCKNRNTWDCEDSGARKNCSDFELDFDALSEHGKELYLILKDGMKT